MEFLSARPMVVNTMVELTIPVIHSFYSSLLLLGGVQGFVLAFVLLQFAGKPGHANRYLAVILVALGAHTLHQFLITTGYITWVKPMIGLNLPLEYLFGPCIYLYIKALTQPKKTQSGELLHFVPVAASLLLLAPFYLLDFGGKWQIITHNLAADSWLGVTKLILPLYIVTAEASFAAYLFASYRLLRAHQRRVKDYFSYAEKVTLSWLSHFLGVFAVFLGIFIVFLVFIESQGAVNHIADGLYIFTLFAIHYLGIGGLLQPTIYPQSETPGTVPSGAGSTTKSSAKYKKSALDRDQQTRISQRLRQLMDQEKPYLNADLTLPLLAQALSVSPNYLSQTLNEHLDVSFFEFVAAYRISHARALLADPANSNMAILDVAMESGFNSRSAFYSAFKNHTGMTPAQFKREQAENLDPALSSPTGKR